METICEVYCVASIVAWFLIEGTILHYSSPSTYAIALCLVCCHSPFSLFVSFFFHTLYILLWYITRSVFLQVLRNTFSHAWHIARSVFFKCSAALSSIHQLVIFNLVLDISSHESCPQFASHRQNSNLQSSHSVSPSNFKYLRSFVTFNPQSSPIFFQIASINLLRPSQLFKLLLSFTTATSLHLLSSHLSYLLHVVIPPQLPPVLLSSRRSRVKLFFSVALHCSCHHL